MPHRDDVDTELPALGIHVTSTTPLGHIVAELRRQGHRDLGAMKRLAARYRLPRRRGLPPAAPPAEEAVVVQPSAPPPPPPEPEEESELPDNATLREWAKAAGIPCPARGRIPGAVIAEWRQQQRAEPGDLAPVEGEEPIPYEEPTGEM